MTAGMAAIELVGGWVFSSMAVMADGWHMGSHALALGLTGAAYLYTRHRAGDERFSFGPWKMEALAGYTSALALVAMALVMAVESVQRLFHPVPIRYDEALGIAVVGLMMNVVCALVLNGRGHHHGQRHRHHGAAGASDHGDLNMRAAYIHVVADAATSVAAIAALLVARYFHVVVVDPIAGIAGAVLVCTWGVGLLRDAGRVLLDREKDTIVIERIRRTLEQVDHTKVTDLHVMRVSRDTYACIVVVVAKPDRSVADFRELLLQNPEIVHTTIEIARS